MRLAKGAARRAVDRPVRVGQLGAFVLLALVCLHLVYIQPLWGSLGGSISGTVTDPNGLAVAGASVTASNTATNVRQTITTNSVGVYSFPDLPVGTYEIAVEATSFRAYRQTNLAVDADSKLRVDAALVLGDQRESVTVASAAERVDTVNTQLGEVIDGSKIVSVPLNGRSFTDLLALRANVAAAGLLA